VPAAKRAGLLIALGALLGGCSSVSVPSVLGGAELTVERLRVPDEVPAGQPYVAVFEGVRRRDPGLAVGAACFRFDTDGPFCFAVTDDPASGTVQAVLVTPIPKIYRLAGSLRYASGTALASSNEVSTTLRVR
jgi:hypothetical protein